MTSATFALQGLHRPHYSAAGLIVISYILRSMMQRTTNASGSEEEAVYRKQLACLSLNGESEDVRAARERTRYYWKVRRIMDEKFHQAMNDNWMGMTRMQWMSFLQNDQLRQQRLAAGSAAAQRRSAKDKQGGLDENDVTTKIHGENGPLTIQMRGIRGRISLSLGI